jgi:NitT/TauT family transport system substrate-binding protein
VNRRTFLTAVPAAALLASCSHTHKIKLALNWKPEPEFGGFYAAPYAQYGLDVDILPGGAGTPTVQMVGAGTADFGIVSGDELAIARARGNDVVAVFAAFQNCPQGIMAHASRRLSGIGQVFEAGTVALQRGLPFAQMLERKFGFGKVKIVPSPGGDLTAFLRDEMFAQQCFIMSEPLAARRQGAAVTVFPVSDIGYNPYPTVLAAGGATLREKPAMVESIVKAVRDGWRAYLDNPDPTNDRMRQLNPSMDARTFAEAAEAQKPLIEAAALGSMTSDRWKTLASQLKDLGDIGQVFPAEEYFRSL